MAMLKRICLIVTFAMALGAPALVRAADAGQSSPAGFQQELIPSDPLSGQNVIEAVWVLVIFLLMVIILYPTAWKQVLAGLKAREERIRKEIADAEAAHRKAEETLGQYNAQLATAEQKVRDLLTQAGAEAEKIAATIRARSQQEAQSAREGAAREIEGAKQAALAEIYEQTANLATAVAEKIIRRNLNPNDQRDLVSQSLEQMKNARQN
jgi:F-type H+-transporting ATPase subunit b